MKRLPKIAFSLGLIMFFWVFFTGLFAKADIPSILSTAGTIGFMTIFGVWVLFWLVPRFFGFRIGWLEGGGIMNPYLYYFRGISFLKMAKAQNKEYSSLYLDKAHSDFSSCVKNNSNYRICPKCGYREISNLGFCRLCGTRLLVGGRR